ncbi:hypothetical protein [Mycolicibacterium iranicum]|uniref:Uncharacterized protein n=1 Tax=Mycolicibacterium iranicum TaxID=912594 RepID=A0A178LSK6_MYCIR|nr:hypothetical protein [Mycolicibacterium iranicum]OAN36990.1 hypothetical protein A4X20_23940 [Mycolicibacterium iranicum]
MRVWAVVIAVLALSTSTVAASAQPPAPVPIPEAPPGTPATVFVDNPAIVDAYPTRPQAWSRLPGDRAVRLHFTIGTPECYGVTVATSETEDEVVVDIRTGTLPTAVDRACIMIALSGGLDVPLHYSLGDRQVLSAT